MNELSRNARILPSLMAIGLSLCLLNTVQAKPGTAPARPNLLKPALGLGVESGAAFYSAEEQAEPTIALRASFSFLDTNKRELGRGLPIRWFGLYGRIQNDFDDEQLRTAAGLSAGYVFFNGELGWTKYTGKQADYSGPELLLGLGFFDIVGLYTRWAWLPNDQTVAELGLRVNYPLWVGQSR